MKLLPRAIAATAAALCLLALTACTPEPVRPNPPVVLPSGTPYTVQAGDSLFSIAKKFNVDWRTILDTNPTLNPGNMPVGTMIVIPSGATAVTPGTEPEPGPEPTVPPGPEPPDTTGERGPLPAESSFIWPVRGGLLCRFQQAAAWRMQVPSNGIDIRAAAGTPVVAAKSGQVNTFTNVAGFGKVVTVQHADGTLSFYGHLDKIKVAHGAWVRQGNVIGLVGASGQSNGPELHFRIYRGDHPVDPLQYLR